MSFKKQRNDPGQGASFPKDVLQVIAVGCLLAFALGGLARWTVPKLEGSTEASTSLGSSHPEVEVEVSNEGTKLAGTLSLPNLKGNFPAILLISGAGAQDRDGLFFGHKRFVELAESFNRAGFAVLRMDDRGVGGSQGKLQNATLEVLAEDALASVRYLANHPKVNSQKIALIGGSEGSLVAALAASRSSQVRAVILLSCLGLPGAELLVDQHGRLARASGASGDEIRETTRLIREAALLAASSSPKKELLPRLRKIDEDLMKLSTLRPFVADQELQREKRLDLLLSTLFRDTLRTDPVRPLSKLTQPVLVIYGDLDVQTHPDSNLEPVRQALEGSSNMDATFHVLPGINHLLQPAKTGLPSEYSQIETAYAPEVLTLMSDWLRDRWANGSSVR